MTGWNESAWFAICVGVALKSTVVLGAAWLAAFLLRGRSAAARHLVWTASAAAVLALPFLSVSLPALPIRVAGRLLPEAMVVFQTSAAMGADRAAAPAAQRSGAPRPAQPAPWRPDWRLSLMLLWAAGTVAACAQLLVACAGMWRVRRASKPSPDRPLSTELARELGILHAVEVLETSTGSMPMTFGIVRPVVFLPSNAAAWSEERRRMVLLHELAHVRRGDAATQWLARLALILNWWNPLAWTAWREFLKERERATDDMVLDAGARASDYAGHLLEVARAMRAAPALGWAAVAMARRSQLEGRLLAILDSGVNRKTAGRASALASSLLAVALVAPFAAVRAQDAASQAVPPDVDATIRAAAAQKNHEMLDKAALAFEASRQYETAQKLLESSAAIREEVAGKQSPEYGIGLMKIADLAKVRRRSAEAEAFYNKALQVLGDRLESAPALMYLGLRKTSPAEAIDYFQRAQLLDPSLAGQAMTWIAVAREREQKPAEAEALYNSALAAVNPNSADAVNTLQLLARLLNEQGREDEGKAMLERASVVQKVLSEQAAQQLQSSPTPTFRVITRDGQQGAMNAAPAAKQSSSNVFRVGGGVMPPAVLAKIDPEYSQEARFAKYSGTVVAYVEIGPDGIARNIRIVKGVGLGLDESAIAAIEKWRFRPGTKDGVPVTVAAHIEVNFKLL